MPTRRKRQRDGAQTQTQGRSSTTGESFRNQGQAMETLESTFKRPFENRSMSDMVSGGQSRSNMGLGGQSRSNMGLGGQSKSNMGLDSQNMSNMRLGGRSMSNMGLGSQSMSNMGLGGQSMSNMGLGGQSISNMGLGGQSMSNMGLGGRSMSNMGMGDQNISNVGLGGRSMSNMGMGDQNISNVGFGDQMMPNMFNSENISNMGLGRGPSQLMECNPFGSGPIATNMNFSSNTSRPSSVSRPNVWGSDSMVLGGGQVLGSHVRGNMASVESRLDSRRSRLPQRTQLGDRIGKTNQNERRRPQLSRRKDDNQNDSRNRSQSGVTVKSRLSSLNNTNNERNDKSKRKGEERNQLNRRERDGISSNFSADHNKNAENRKAKQQNNNRRQFLGKDESKKMLERVTEVDCPIEALQCLLCNDHHFVDGVAYERHLIYALHKEKASLRKEKNKLELKYLEKAAELAMCQANSNQFKLKSHISHIKSLQSKPFMTTEDLERLDKIMDYNKGKLEVLQNPPWEQVVYEKFISEYNCKVCNKTSSNIDEYEEHLSTLEHLKKAFEEDQQMKKDENKSEGTEKKSIKFEKDIKTEMDDDVDTESNNVEDKDGGNDENILKCRKSLEDKILNEEGPIECVCDIILKAKRSLSEIDTPVSLESLPTSTKDKLHGPKRFNLVQFYSCIPCSPVLGGTAFRVHSKSIDHYEKYVEELKRLEIQSKLVQDGKNRIIVRECRINQQDAVKESKKKINKDAEAKEAKEKEAKEREEKERKNEEMATDLNDETVDFEPNDDDLKELEETHGYASDKDDLLVFENDDEEEQPNKRLKKNAEDKNEENVVEGSNEEDDSEENDVEEENDEPTEEEIAKALKIMEKVKILKKLKR